MTATTESAPVKPAPTQVVGLAASAGGLAALTAVLGPLPRKFPVPIVVVEHLQPDKPSALAAILARRTELRVKEAQEGDVLEPGWVYVAPPDAHTTVSDGCIALDAGPPIHYSRPSADVLFASLAEEYGSGALVIVLSGVGSDGADGVLAVHRAGGIVIVQDAETAAFRGMPAAAKATRVADAIVDLRDIATDLLGRVSVRSL